MSEENNIYVLDNDTAGVINAPPTLLKNGTDPSYPQVVDLYSMLFIGNPKTYAHIVFDDGRVCSTRNLEFDDIFAGVDILTRTVFMDGFEYFQPACGQTSTVYALKDNGTKVMMYTGASEGRINNAVTGGLSQYTWTDVTEAFDYSSANVPAGQIKQLMFYKGSNGAEHEACLMLTTEGYIFNVGHAMKDTGRTEVGTFGNFALSVEPGDDVLNGQKITNLMFDLVTDGSLVRFAAICESGDIITYSQENNTVNPINGRYPGSWHHFPEFTEGASGTRGKALEVFAVNDYSYNWFFVRYENGSITWNEFNQPDPQKFEYKFTYNTVFPAGTFGTTQPVNIKTGKTLQYTSNAGPIILPT